MALDFSPISPADVREAYARQLQEQQEARDRALSRAFREINPKLVACAPGLEHGGIVVRADGWLAIIGDIIRSYVACGWIVTHDAERGTLQFNDAARTVAG